MNFWHKLHFNSARCSRCLWQHRPTSLSNCFQKDNKLQTAYILSIFSIILFSPITTTAQSTPANDDTNFAQSLESELDNGQAVWLDDGKTKFFSVFNPDQSGDLKGGVIILHDANSNPDKPEVIRPLRTDLPTHGWASISIQLPYLSSINDYSNNQTVINQRIISAVAYMQTVGISNIALIGHGTGAMAATTYLASQPGASIQAFVAISLGILNKDKKEDSISQQLEKITVPILDIYGSNDLDHVTSTAISRAQAAKISSDSVSNSKQLSSYKRSAIAKSSAQKLQGYISYRQIVIDGASHDFSGATQQLTKRVAGWLERHAKGIAVSASR